MANIVPSSTSLDQRRVSLQPNSLQSNSLSPPISDQRRSSLQACSLTPPVEIYRRSTCPSDQLRNSQKEFFNKRVNSFPTDVTEATASQKSPGFIETVNSFFRSKSWNSDEALNAEGRSISLNSSNTSLKTVSPLMTRRDLEQYDFIIPHASTTTQKQISVYKEAPHVGKIDVTQYLTNEEAQELQEVGTQLRLGEAKFCIVYIADDAKLKFILKSVSVFLKPSPSVVGCNWVCETTTFIELLQDKRKPIEITNEQEHLIDIKNDDVSTKTIRLTVYDNRRKHMKNPIGHVLFPLRDVPNLRKVNIHSKKLTFYSQPAGFNKGNIIISLSWAVSAQRLEIKIGKASNLKNEHGVNGRELYLKMTVFILENKYKVYKTSPVKATPDVNFREKFTLPLTSPQLKDSTLTFHLYMKGASKKRLITKTLTGKTVIGPYMKHGDRSLSQWEKMVTTPMEEITERHILYL